MRFDEYIAHKQAEYGSRFDPSSLSAQFVPYFNSGARIEVTTCGTRLRGRIGVTTGWRPCFLLMRRRSDRGSSWTLSDSDRIEKVVCP